MFGNNFIMKKNKPVEIEAPSLEYIYAKTQTDGEIVKPGQTLWLHSLIAGYIARYLISLFPKNIRDLIFPRGTEFVVSLHDLGKISPSFMLRLFKDVEPSYRPVYFDSLSIYENSCSYSHSKVGGLFFSDKCKSVSYIVGQHHGFFSSSGALVIEGELFGGKKWNQRREQLVNQLFKKLCSTETALSTIYANFNLITAAQLSAISGLTTISDWLASSELFCKLTDCVDEKFISERLTELGFKKLSLKPNLDFLRIFNFEPNLLQQKFFEIVQPGGVYILEAPMGIGKTEAALYAAYKILSTSSATGIYFALPTQTTSNKIYERFIDFVDVISDKNSFACKLLHSKSRYYEINNGSTCSETFSWFDAAKRGLLSTFAVGTIDQALMSVLNVKHGFIRDFGLAGKVVILDEIHTYDCYTQVFIKELVNRLHELQCTVIILSATLQSDVKQNLLNSCSTFKYHVQDNYPLISYIGKDDKVIDHFAFDKEFIKPKSVSVEFHSEEECISEVMRRAAEGQQVVWIENTVEKSQQIYTCFCEKYNDRHVNPIEIGLIHSKFIMSDRSSIEHEWLNILGKSVNDSSRLKSGRILIGTQILEQSIDIDADFIISRIAPADMLLQRIGRLWRHERTRNKSAKCNFWIVDVDIEKALCDPYSIFGKSCYVYEPYVLCRTVEVMKSVKQIEIPRDIPKIINKTYMQRIENDSWKKLKNIMETGTDGKKGSCQLIQKAKSKLSKDGVITPDSDDVSSRYVEEPCSSIIVCKKFEKCDSYLDIVFYDGFSIRINKKQCNYNQSKILMTEIENNSVPCPVSKLPPRIKYSEARDLGLTRHAYLGKNNEEEINVAIMIYSDTDGTLSNNSFVPNSDKYDYFYNSYKGLVIRGKNGE